VGQVLDLLTQDTVFVKKLRIDEALQASRHARQQLANVHTAVAIHIKGADDRVVESIGL
jgi:hypothetical protein